MDISDYTSQVNRRDTILNDVWGRGRYSFGDWIPNAEDEFFRFEQHDDLLGKSLDLIKERRENAMVQLAYYQHKLK